MYFATDATWGKLGRYRRFQRTTAVGGACDTRPSTAAGSHAGPFVKALDDGVQAIAGGF
jgi:hypothetical protein